MQFWSYRPLQYVSICSVYVHVPVCVWRSGGSYWYRSVWRWPEMNDFSQRWVPVWVNQCWVASCPATSLGQQLSCSWLDGKGINHVVNEVECTATSFAISTGGRILEFHSYLRFVWMKLQTKGEKREKTNCKFLWLQSKGCSWYAEFYSLKISKRYIFHFNKYSFMLSAKIILLKNIWINQASSLPFSYLFLTNI